MGEQEFDTDNQQTENAVSQGVEDLPAQWSPTATGRDESPDEE